MRTNKKFIGRKRKLKRRKIKQDSAKTKFQLRLKGRHVYWLGESRDKKANQKFLSDFGYLVSL